MNLKPGAHIHLMGICGTAMASLAGILQSMGYKITGSDENVYPPMSTQLESLGIQIMQGYKKENLLPAPDFVIVGNVITRKMEESQCLLQSDIPYTSLPKAVGDFVIADRDSVVLTGTHGKTTMTSMMTWVLETCGKYPGYLVGGMPLNFTNSFRAPKKDVFVIEGDEYDTAFFDKVPKFIHYKPKFAVLSSVEFDHIDIYNNIDDVKKAFYLLMESMHPEGVLVINGDDENVREIATKAPCRVVSYGEKNADYKYTEREVISGRNHFSVEYKGDKVANIALKFFGQHNTLNALGVYVLAKEMGLKNYQILQALASFKGVKRRQEYIGDINGAPVIEDFAHHPTAVELTVGCMREAYPGKKLIAIFEPRSATARRNVFQQEYVQAFAEADEIYIAQPFNQEKIQEEERFSTDQLIADLQNKGKHAQSFHHVEEILQDVQSKCDENTCVLIMSNGAFQGIYKKLLG
ncbi:MAG: UDP-N-acetylmuramate:L-alanyl-gamma-D-glutamyl-meso-diaminopimelate ligase [Bdellovibrionaceae bacterium]|jgi:UDP-N-acetylmuramate: L-alanyl-gamma-D-glutamyl-meso-diaminopimelate ligase|nr:UDP-N-acetylmuramate:L-alanyl-gamma-D-glutamyl-meso-diaminopimelate ligase [Pseudobdellovibrionaceae bacterium]